MVNRDWFYEIMKCVACGGAPLARTDNAISCPACKTNYPISNGTPLLLSPRAMLDTAEIIARNLGGVPVEAVERAFGTALRYRLKDLSLRGEFSGVVDRYAPLLPAEPPAPEASTLSAVPKLELIAEYFNPRFTAGRTEYRSIRVRNPSQVTIASSGQNPFHISYWLRTAGGEVIEGVRSNFPIPLMPGRELTIPVAVKAPSDPGVYDIEVRLVQEFVGWSDGPPLYARATLVEAGPLPRPNLVTPPHNGAFDFVDDRDRSGEIIHRAVSMAAERRHDGAVMVLEVACGNDPLSLR